MTIGRSATTMTASQVKRARILIEALEGFDRLEKFHLKAKLPARSLCIDVGEFTHDGGGGEGSIDLDPVTAKMVLSKVRAIIESELVVLGVDLMSVV